MKKRTKQGREIFKKQNIGLCEALGADKTRTTRYHPQTDGMVERQNRTIQQMLSAYVNEKRDDWSDHLDLIMMAYRSSVHQSTQCTPNLIMFGREVNLPLTVKLGVFPTGDRPQCPVEYVEWVQNTLKGVFRFVRVNTESSVHKQKHYHDRNCKTGEVEPGMWMWRWYPPKAKVKLGLGWTGPFKVVERIGESAVRIMRDSKVLVVHINDVKPYEGKEQLGSEEESESEQLECESEDGENDGDEGGGQMVVEGWDEGDVRSSPVKTRTGREVRAPRRYSPSPSSS